MNRPHPNRSCTDRCHTRRSRAGLSLGRRDLGILFALLAILPGLLPSTQADEGMWTFDNFPAARVAGKYGFAPGREWLERVRLASARLANGCSASFVSPDGLVLTNHHCAQECAEALSTPARDYDRTGFLAAEAKDEARCPGFEVNQLLEISDVTAEVNEATRGLDGQAFLDARRAVTAKIESACATAADLRCDLVTLYAGGLYHLYRYRRWQDVRLVFAPELAAGFFGGDPDNFNFPRYDLDSAFLRVYENGRPGRTADYFRLADAPPKEGEVVFVSGNPGSTSRLATVAELEFEHNYDLPLRMNYLSEERGMLAEYGRRGAEEKRTSIDLLLGVENSLKSLRGLQRALGDPALMARKAAEEQDLRRRVDADPALKASAGGAWDAIARAMDDRRPLLVPHWLIEEEQGFDCALFDFARTLVRSAEELPKPAGRRLPEFEEAQLPALKQGLFDPAPVHKDVEILTLAFSLTKLREELGADDSFVRTVLGPFSPRELAESAVKGSRLDDASVRKALFTGGAAAIEASQDPMIRLARRIDPEARAVRRKYEDTVAAVVAKNMEAIAKARFALFGTADYPDATFSPRLSFGTVRGWTEGNRTVAPFTTIGGMFERATGREPFELPGSWLKARSRLDPATPLNFTTDNDIVGGNSGSPLLNRDARLVGVVFDGNIHSLAGDYWFDERVNRTVALTGAAILEALEKVYGARRLAAELRGASKR